MKFFNFFKGKNKYYAIDPYAVVFLLFQENQIWRQPHCPPTLINLYPEYNFKKTWKYVEKKGWVVPTDKQASLENLTLEELKTICTNSKLSASGPKKVLIQTIMETFSETALENLDLPVYTQLSELGQRICIENEHITYIKKNRPLFLCSLKNLQKFREKNPDLTTKELFIHGLTHEDFNIYFFVDLDNGKSKETVIDEHYKMAIKKVKEDFKN